MTLTNGKEITIEGILVKVTITDRISNCNGCFLKGELCRKRSDYGIKNCFVGNSPIIFQKVEVPNHFKQEIETLIHLEIDKKKIIERYGLTEEQFDYIISRKV